MSAAIARRLFAVWLCLAFGAIASVAAADTAPLRAPTARRLLDRPIITRAHLPQPDGDNINGPSLIRVPDWVEAPLGRYYLYFGHHLGRYIRLAYADALTGPWKVHGPGALRIEDTPCDGALAGHSDDPEHIASPDVHVDHAERRIRMYFHCPAWVVEPKRERDRQLSYVATSSDGLRFEARAERLARSYLRVFQWRDHYYGIAMPGIVYRSKHPLSGFVRGAKLFRRAVRHSAVLVRDGTLFVFYSKKGDLPERILVSSVDLTPEWTAWQATPPVVVLEPERDWEGANLPLQASQGLMAMEPLHQLRDPAIFVEDGRTYLLYAVAGESGIGIALLEW